MSGSPMEVVLRRARIRHIAVLILSATLWVTSCAPRRDDIFRGLAAKSPVSGEEYWAFRAEGRDFWRESLLDDFSISEIWSASRPETGCASAETGSKPTWQ